jgi:hypothetical protein
VKAEHHPNSGVLSPTELNRSARLQEHHRTQLMESSQLSQEPPQDSILQKKSEKKQKKRKRMEKTEELVEGVCNFFIAKKKRYCNLTPIPGIFLFLAFTFAHVHVTGI